MLYSNINKYSYVLMSGKRNFISKKGDIVWIDFDSFIKKLPTRYALPENLDTNGQVTISQLKSLDFKEKN